MKRHSHSFHAGEPCPGECRGRFSIHQNIDIDAPLRAFLGSSICHPVRATGSRYKKVKAGLAQYRFLDRLSRFARVRREDGMTRKNGGGYIRN